MEAGEKRISLELGSGGKLMRDFIARHIVPAFRNPLLEDLGDASHLPLGIAFTTDSYVVDPIFFPGGDIGTLAVNGTVNDLVVSGATPQYISLAVILEEGLPWPDLERILKSIKRAASKADVQVACGDTKVVRRGQADKLYINTSGVGLILAKPRASLIRPGDRIILTGTLGEHSLAVMLAREEFGMEARVRSDCAPLNYLLPIWEMGALWMRDVTRGGLATILSELAEKIPHALLIEEEKIPLSPAVRGASELLGIDPLYLACEGRAVIVAPRRRAAAILKKIRQSPSGKRAADIGQVDDRTGRPGELLLSTTTGGLRLLEPLTSELLPRIC
ncbi:MAG: hydrogenase expression/formation protein HypE [Candidatus Aminicenantes bacterium RBG_13_59_9]|nr:MAG: hydrogenase expression/formation protein HypE [Candidatus Aminicenantes bacterium RBG_13_59_9]